MARVMEKMGARRLGAAQPKQVVKNKGKVSRPSVVPKPSAVAKVIKVVAPAKKERSSSRPPAAVVQARPAVAALPPIARPEATRLNGSEHGVAVSRTDHLKARFAALSASCAQIKALKRSMQKNFFEVATHLQRIRVEKLYEVKGYGSFEPFLEREIDLDKLVCIRLSRMPSTLVREAAMEAGFERACAAVAAMEGDTFAPSPVAAYPVNSTVSSALPAHKR